MTKANAMKVETTLGTTELEQGLHPGRAAEVVRIALIAAGLLLIFNSSGLARWTQNLPSNAATAAIAEAAAVWNERMQTLGPAKLFDRVREQYKINQD